MWNVYGFKPKKVKTGPRPKNECPSCGSTMVLLLSGYVCDTCDPPKVPAAPHKDVAVTFDPGPLKGIGPKTVYKLYTYSTKPGKTTISEGYRTYDDLDDLKDMLGKRQNGKTYYIYGIYDDVPLNADDYLEEAADVDEIGKVVS